MDTNHPLGFLIGGTKMSIFALQASQNTSSTLTRKQVSQSKSVQGNLIMHGNSFDVIHGIKLIIKCL